MFMAIVIPVAVHGLRVASQAGQMGERKSTAARLGQRVLNEILVTGQWRDSAGGTLTDSAHEYRWRASSAAWTESALRLVTVQVSFTLQGQDYDVNLSTLASDTQL